MFRTLSGTVNNITFTSVHIVVNKNKDNQYDNALGTIAGKMTGGKIENVQINYAYIDNIHYRDVSSSGQYVNSYVGGFVGHMTGGTITNCSILGGNIRANAKKCQNNSDAHAFSGGIVGRLGGGTITNCSRADAVIVYSYAEQDTGRNSGSAVRSAAGGIAGYGSSNSVLNCKSSATNLKAEWTVGSKTATSSYCHSNAIIGH
jgi:hypothetical protein